MELIITDKPKQEDDDKVIAGTRAYNCRFIDKAWLPLSVYIRDQNDVIIAGLTGKTFGNWLHIEYLWVSEEQRGKDLGSKVLSAAESEAINRECIASTLDTYSFQALDFYKKQGYVLVGSLNRYYGTHQRHYLQKQLVAMEIVS